MLNEVYEHYDFCVLKKGKIIFLVTFFYFERCHKEPSLWQYRLYHF